MKEDRKRKAEAELEREEMEPSVTFLWQCYPNLVMDLSTAREEELSTVEGRNEMVHAVCGTKPRLLVTPRVGGSGELAEFVRKLEGLQRMQGRK